MGKRAMGSFSDLKLVLFFSFGWDLFYFFWEWGSALLLFVLRFVFCAGFYGIFFLVLFLFG